MHFQSYLQQQNDDKVIADFPLHRVKSFIYMRSKLIHNNNINIEVDRCVCSASVVLPLDRTLNLTQILEV